MAPTSIHQEETIILWCCILKEDAVKIFYPTGNSFVNQDLHYSMNNLFVGLRDFFVLLTQISLPSSQELIESGSIGQSEGCWDPIDQSEAATLIRPDIRDIVTRSQTSSTSGGDPGLRVKVMVEETQHTNTAFDFIGTNTRGSIEL